MNAPNQLKPEVLHAVMRRKDAPVDLLLEFISFELRDALDSLPPHAERREDPFHAGCAVLRAWSVVLELQDRARAPTTPRDVGRSNCGCPRCMSNPTTPKEKP